MAEIEVSIAGKSASFASGVTAFDAVKELCSSKQRKKTLAVHAGDQQLDLTTVLEADVELTPIMVGSAEGLDLLRHSGAHIMAQAVVELFGKDVQVAIGPSTADGFYYDFDRDTPFTPDDFAAIEKKVKQIVGQNLPFSRQTMSRDEAISYFKEKDQVYKVELIEDLAEDEVSLYSQGSFVDLCRGPHIPHTGFMRSFKIMRLAGAYWRGDEKRPMLQRLYATAFFDPKELKKYLHVLEEAKKRDHRKLGRELELFTINDQVGPGLALWLPKGALVRKLIEDYWREEHYKHGYDLLFSPHIAKRDMWATSGHLDFYSEDMFSSMDVEGVEYQLKPMNCPFHIGIYKFKKRSYRDFPLRWCELGTVYRYERTGALQGLMRVRGFTQDDAHIFVLPSQLEEEIFNILDFNLKVLEAFGFTEYDIFLSTRPEKSVGTDDNWERSTNALKLALEKKGLAFEVDPGEGVFYGPKIDIKIKDVLGRSWQCSTIQVDFNLPERFAITYTGDDNAEHQPIMIHRALMGSLERFFGVLIEHYAGAFPLWLAPVQVKILNITDNQLDFAEVVYQQLRQAGIRVEKDIRNEKLNFKIREAQVAKVPFMVILGDKEVETNQVTVRLLSGKNLDPMPVAQLAEHILVEASIRG